VVGLVTVAAILVAALGADSDPADPGGTSTMQDDITPQDQAEEPPTPEPPSTPGDEDTPSQTELTVGDDGCTVSRGELANEDEIGPEWWFVEEGENFVPSLRRPAEGETSYRYTEPGRYRVALRTEAIGEGDLLSNQVTLDC
jgi:hypothetical protein